MQDLLLFVAGCGCAAIGGELFVHGLVGVAVWGRIPKGIVAATLGAFATSSPELIVGLTSASQGLPELSLGDVTGSNVVNVAVILAIPILMFGLTTTRDAVFRDLPFALAIFPLLAYVGRDGTVSASDAWILLGAFAVWLALVLLSARRNRTGAADAVGAGRAFLFMTTITVGLLTLVLAGQLIVAGASGLAASAGLPAFFIGVTIVAFGTSVPELATVLVASLRGHQDVGLQTILGSNVFNCLFIVPVAALIHPIDVVWTTFSFTLAAGLAATLLVIPLLSWRLGRWRGLALIAIYIAFVSQSVLGVR